MLSSSTSLVGTTTTTTTTSVTKKSSTTTTTDGRGNKKRSFDMYNDNNSTTRISNRYPRFHHSSTWSTYETLQFRSLYGNQYFGRKIHVSGRSILQRFQCYEDQIYYFYFPDYTSCTPFVCDYAHSANDGNLLAVPDEEGRISIIRTDKSNDISQGQYHCSFYCHANAVVDVKWSRDDTMLLTSAADSKSRIMDVETQQCLGTFIGHRAILRSGNWHPTNPHLLVTACTDGSFQIWDTRYRQLGISNDDKFMNDEQINGLDLGSYPMYGPIKAVPDAHVEPNSIIKKKRPVKTITAGRTVTCALFYPNEEEKVITSGSFDGAIKLWDCRAGRSPSTLQATHFQQNGRRKGISDMKIDHSETRLFSVCMDSSIYMHYLLDLTEPARRYTDPSYNSSCFTIKLSVSHDDQFLLAGSNNSNNVYAWDVDGDPTVAHAFEGHTDTVSGVAWHKSNNYQFASCSDDFKVRIWKI